MPSDPEHKLDRPLRALADQRRAAAGKDLELHLATRRLLLGEARRCYPRREKPRVPWLLVLRDWAPRIVSVAGFLVILILAVWGGKTFWANLPDLARVPRDGAAPREIKFSLRKQPADEEARLAIQEGKGPQPLSHQAAAAAEKADQDALPFPGNLPLPSASVAGGGGALQSRRVSTNPFALASGMSPGPKSEMFNPALPSNLATSSVAALVQNLTKKTPGSAPPAEPSPSTSSRWLFARTDDANRSSGAALGSAARSHAAQMKAASPVAKALPAPAAAPVLSSFELRREGPKVTLIDADGSVYEGEVLAGDSKSTASATGDQAGPVSLDRIVTGPVERTEGALLPPSYSFRASGTNFSLGQPVVVFATLSGAAGPAGTALREKDSAPPSPPPPAVAPPASTRSLRSALPPEARPAGTTGAGANGVFLQGQIRLGTQPEQAFQAAPRTN